MCFPLQALYYYWQAAVEGHHQAQYRYAKLLLTSKAHQSKEELNTAIHLLEQAAAAGLSEVGNREKRLLTLNSFTQYHRRKSCSKVPVSNYGHVTLIFCLVFRK